MTARLSDPEIEEGLRQLGDLVHRATLAHNTQNYAVARELINEAKALVKRIDPDIELPVFQ